MRSFKSATRTKELQTGGLDLACSMHTVQYTIILYSVQQTVYIFTVYVHLNERINYYQICRVRLMMHSSEFENLLVIDIHKINWRYCQIPETTIMRIHQDCSELCNATLRHMCLPFPGAQPGR